MVRLQYICEKCGTGFKVRDEAEKHEDQPITHDGYKSGYCFKTGKSEFSEHGIVASRSYVNFEHVQVYSIFTTPPRELMQLSMNPSHRTKMSSMAGDQNIEEITDEEFSRKKEWLKNIFSTEISSYGFELTNKK